MRFVWSSKVWVEHTLINHSLFLLLELSNRTCVRKHCKAGMLCSIGCLLKFSAATGAPAFTVHLEYCDSKLSPSSIIPSHFHCPSIPQICFSCTFYAEISMPGPSNTPKTILFCPQEPCLLSPRPGSTPYHTVGFYGAM